MGMEFKDKGGDSMNFFLNSDIVNLLFKTNCGRGKRPNFVIFVACCNCWWVDDGCMRQKVLSSTS